MDGSGNGTEELIEFLFACRAVVIWQRESGGTTLQILEGKKGC